MTLVEILFLLWWERVQLFDQRKGGYHVQNAKEANVPPPPTHTHTHSARDIFFFFYNICHSGNIVQVSKPSSSFLKLRCLYSGAALWDGLPSVRTTKPLNLTRFKDGINVYHSLMGTHTAKTKTRILGFHYLQILMFLTVSKWSTSTSMSMHPQLASYILTEKPHYSRLEQKR